MTFRNLRDFLQDLSDHAELRVVNGADWNIEIGALAEQLVQRRDSPTVICDNIPGYPQGYRVLINALNTPRQMAVALNFSEEIRTKRQLLEVWRKYYGHHQPVPPKWIRSAPVMEQVDREGQVDLYKFPTPKWHEKDGGRYIGTGDLVIQKDPETGAINVGTYRVQIQGNDLVTVWPIAGKDGYIIREKYFARGEPCPVVVSVGHAPDLFLAASSTFPYNMPEFDLVGGLRGEPVEIIAGELTGLPIPAEAELVLEGEWLPPGELMVKEGPFGEWPGYYASGETDEPAVRVRRVYYRSDPIILGMPPVRPPSYLQYEVQWAARIWDELQTSGIPGIVAVNMLPAGGLRFWSVVAIRQLYAGHAKQVGRIVASSRTGGFMGRFTVVVEEDVDIFNTDEVLWAMATRCDPAEDIEILKGCWSSALDSLISPERRQRGDFTNSRAIIDATRPFVWRNQFPQVSASSPEWKEKVLAKWNDLFQ